MQSDTLSPRLFAGSAVAIVAAGALLVSCVEPDSPVGPEDENQEERPASPTLPSSADVSVLFRCAADVAGEALACEQPGSTVGEGVGGNILGGQGIYITLASSGVSYDVSAQVFQADVTVQNLIGQAFGTVDGSTVGGVKAFFHAGPNTTGGSGTVSVRNEDGTGTFTASGQPYFHYVQILDPNETSNAKSWKWDVPSTVTSFSFEVYVEGDLQYPNGFVEVTPEADGLAVAATTQLAGNPKDHLGNDVSGRVINWTTSDPNVATVDGTGLVTAQGAGTATITASSDGGEADGTASISVGGADVGVASFSVTDGPILPGDDLVHVITLENYGPDDVAADTVFLELDAGMSSLSISRSGCLFSDQANSMLVFCSVGPLAAGDTAITRITTRPDGSGTVTSTTYESHGPSPSDPNAANDTAKATTVVSSAPNLVAGGLTITPEVPFDNETVDIEGSISNTGETDAGPFTWRILAGNTELASGSESGLPAGFTLPSTTVNANGSGPLAEADYKLQLVVDPLDDVAEGDETDNVTIDLLPIQSPGYDITLEFVTSLSAADQQYFIDAVNRWESVVTGDLEAFPGGFGFGVCGQPQLTETIDDIHLYVKVEPIDGSGSILGSGGPCIVRANTSSDPDLPFAGNLTIDSDDFDALKADGRLSTVIVHEIGHVMGVGTIWDDRGLIVGEGTSDPYFTGVEADNQFDLAGGETEYPGDPKVPVENTGGSGTRDGHWRESILETELMTGYIEPAGTLNELSAITVGQFQDVGYVVDFASSEIDSYTVPSSGSSVAADLAAGALQPFDIVIQPEWIGYRDGRRVRIRRR